jgi:hypothetical protein
MEGGGEEEEGRTRGSSGRVFLRSGNVRNGRTVGNVTVSPGTAFQRPKQGTPSKGAGAGAGAGAVASASASAVVGGTLSLKGGDVFEHAAAAGGEDAEGTGATADSSSSSSSSGADGSTTTRDGGGAGGMLVGGGVEVRGGEGPHEGGALLLLGGTGRRAVGGTVRVEAGSGLNSGSLQFVIPDNAEGYVRGVKGAKACPEGYAPITAVEDCIAATHAVGLRYDGRQNSNVGRVC